MTRHNKSKRHGVLVIKHQSYLNYKYKDDEIKPTRLFPININVDKINNYEFKKLLKINNNEKKDYNAALIINNSNEPKIDISNYNITLTLNC